jgi:peptidoglycan/xylan/chitin deacetylase (PgdA/CDA1 family)
MIDLPDFKRISFSAIRSRPDFSWPGGKRLACYLALNLEHFIYGEGGVDFDRTSPSPNLRSYLWREYGNRVGIWRLLDLFDELNFPLAVIANTAVYDHAPEIMLAHRVRCDEIIGHGITNSKPLAVMEEVEERKLIQDVTARLTKEEGKPPKGWLSPYLAPSERTPDLLAEYGYEYTMDFGVLDDQPFWCKTAPSNKVELKPLLCLPYPIELNDQPAMVFRRDTPDQFFSTAIDQFDEMFRSSDNYTQVFVVSLHSFIAGQPYRLKYLRKLLEHIQAHEANVWITKPREVAQYYRKVLGG